MNYEKTYREILTIRKFEERVLTLFSKGELVGTTHTCVGQEFVPVIVSEFLLPEDIVIGNHRSHGHFLARTKDYQGLLDELRGLPSGVSNGYGGSQHLFAHNFYSNGILGNFFPVGIGLGLAQKRMGRNNLVVIYMSDGAWGGGITYETLNLASLWQLPILFVVENNHIAQTTPISAHLAGSIPKRFSAFEIGFRSFEGGTPDEFYEQVEKVIGAVRIGKGPQGLIIRVPRLAPHSKGDDTRSEDVLTEERNKDILPQFEVRVDSASIKMGVEEFINALR